MALLTYPCPACGSKLGLHLLKDACVCPHCHSEVTLTPHHMQSKWFSLFILITSILLGHVLGVVRMMTNKEFDLLQLSLDLLIYYFLYWVIRIVLFQFQRVELVRSSSFVAVTRDDAV